MSYIKCCGFCRADDIAVAVKYGADAIGFVCYDKSPRFVSPQAIAQLVAAADGVDKVAVVVNPNIEQIDELAAAGVNVIQLHGDESPLFVQQIRKHHPKLTISKALAADALLLENMARFQSDVDYFLIDTPTPAYGGSGRSFDWRHLQDLPRDSQFLIAGGLDADKIAFLQTQNLGEWGYDVSSSLESAGLKNKYKIKALLTAVRNKGQ